MAMENMVPLASAAATTSASHSTNALNTIDDTAASNAAAAAATEKLRKTSQFLSVVDEELRHLSITDDED